jgi:polyhydroxyalkanoate synthesis repressor PhaR
MIRGDPTSGVRRSAGALKSGWTFRASTLSVKRNSWPSPQPLVAFSAQVMTKVAENLFSQCDKRVTVASFVLFGTARLCLSAGKMATEKQPTVIKKYANRRLYHTGTSTYVTLDDLAGMVKAGEDFVVFDAKSGEEITRSVLTQIIFEQEGKGGQNLLPITFLRQLIRFYGDSIGRFVPSYLQVSLETLVKEQERFRKQFTGAFTPAGAFEAYQEQARKNLALFEQAMSMFSPFAANKTGAKADDAAPKTDGGESASTSRPAAAKPASGSTETPESDELTAMRNELAAMQARIEKLAKKS